MKRILLSIVVCAFSTAGNAQWVTGGPEIGLNLSTLSSMYNGTPGDNGIRPGLKLGAVVDIGFTKHFSLEPGMFYSVKGAREEFVTTTSSAGGNILTTRTDKYDYRIDYLEIPVNLKFKFGPLFLGGGPYVARALGGTSSAEHTTVVSGNGGSDVTNYKKSTSALVIGNNAATDDVRAADMGLNLNVGLQSPVGFFVRANWGIGLANITPGGDDNNYMHNNTFTISAGYLFGR